MRRAGVILLLLLMRATGAEVAAEADLPARFHELVAGVDAERAAARAELVPELLFSLPRGALLPVESRPTVEDVRAALASRDPVDRILGAAAAARLGIAAKPLLDAVIARLEEDCDPLRYWLYETIRRLGPEARSAAPTLASLLHQHADWRFCPDSDWSPDRPYRDAGNANLAALSAIGPAGLAAARKSLAGRSYVRPGANAAIRILARIHGPPPKPAAKEEPPPRAAEPGRTPKEWVALLDEAAEKKDWPRFHDLADELWSKGSHAVPALLLGTEAVSKHVRVTSVAILAKLGPKARAAGPRLFSLVTSGDEGIRPRAARALGATGAGDPAWVPALVPLLDDEALRFGVVETLGAIRPPAAPARGKLIEILLSAGQDSHVLLRAAAATALGRIGGPPEELVPALLQAGASGASWYPPPGSIPPYEGPRWLRPPNAPPVLLREQAADAIAAFGLPALPHLRAGLASESPEVRAAAAFALSRFPPAAVSESAVHAAADPDPGVRSAAVPALERAADEPALRALATLLGDEVRAVRAGAVDALAALGPAAEPAAPALVPLLASEDNQEAWRAAEVLWEIGPDAETLLVPATAEAVRRRPECMGAAGWRLAHHLGDRARGAAEAFAAALRRCDEEGRRLALIALGKIAPDHPAYWASLRRLLDDPSAKLRREAVWRIGASGLSDPETVGALGRLLDDPDPGVAAGAAAVLAGLAPRSPPAVQALAGRLSDAPDAVRAHAARGLAAAGRGEEAAENAIALLESEDATVRRIAVETIATTGGVEAAFAPLRRLFETEDDNGVRIGLYPAIASTGAEGAELVFEWLRKNSRRHHHWHLVLKALARGGEHAVPRLRDWLRSRDITLYYGAAVLLGRIGEPARAAIPDLVALADTGKEQALGAAIEGLSLMGAPPDVLLPLIARGIHGDYSGRLNACQAIGRIGPTFAPIVPAVARAVPSLRNLSLYDVLEALPPLGEEALPALPYLMAAIPGAHDGRQRARLVECLGRLAAWTDEPRAALVFSLDDPSPRVRAAAAESLAARFADDGRVVLRLGRLLDDPERDVRLRAAALLEGLGPRALPALPELVATAEEAERALSRICLRALAGIPAAAEVVRPRLLGLAAGPDAWRAHDALAALGRLGGPASQLGPLFRASLGAWDWRRRVGAIQGLSAWGGDPEAEPILAELSEAASFPVRWAARRALGR